MVRLGWFHGPFPANPDYLESAVMNMYHILGTQYWESMYWVNLLEALTIWRPFIGYPILIMNDPEKAICRLTALGRHVPSNKKIFKH